MVYFTFHWFIGKSWESRIISKAAIGAVCSFCTPIFAQELIVIEVNSYKTALPLDGVGDWNDPSTWEVWDGMVWNPAISAPERNNDVFIEQSEEVRLTQNQEVKNLYLFSSATPGRKLNLQDYNLDIYGALRCFTGSDGIFYFEGSTSLLLDWIYPETGNIIFKGTSRTIVDRASWSANNLNSRFGVIFNPDAGDTLTVNAAFKANSFTVQSGTVIQTVNSEGTEATSTFSFNTQEAFGPDGYGDFVIEPGATLISDGTNEFGQIIRRSDSKPAAIFHLKEGGTLILYGQDPVIEAQSILLEGDVHYNGESGDQQFITSSMVTDPTTYNNIFFNGVAIKTLPSFLDLKGDLTFNGGGDIFSESTLLHITGEGNQEISNLSLLVASLQIQKTSGTLFLNEDLSITEHFTMNSGTIDFLNNQLFISLSESGSYSYYGGAWKNLAQLNYHHLPPELTALNTTFPFEDQNLGGERKIFLSGTNPAANANLALVYTQVPGVNWDPGFNDLDRPILYKVNSFFTFGVTNSAGSQPVELQISADSLFVVAEEDLRLVGDEGAAPGEHLPGIFDGEYHGRRSLTFNDLNDSQTFTLGSTGIASVLPVSWLSYSAEELFTGNLISWSTTREIGNDRFIILKSAEDGEEFVEIGEVSGSENTNKIQYYSFLDKGINRVEMIFYQIKQVDLNGGLDFSPVFPLHRTHKTKDRLRIFPNPYEKGELSLLFPPNKKDLGATIQVKTISGMALMEASGKLEEASGKVISRLKEFGSGAYLIIIKTNGERKVIKWLKK